MSRIVGRIRTRRGGRGELVLEGQRGISLDVEQMRSLLPGDRVAATLVGSTRGPRQRHGHNRGQRVRILEVLERPLQQVVGRIQRQGKRVVIAPVHPSFDRRLPIEHRDLGGAHVDELVLAELYERAGRFAARVVQVLGSHYSLAATDAAIAEHAIPDVFPEPVLMQAQGFAAEICPQEVARRIDLRDEPLVTIDGEDARDFDDAVCAHRDSDGWRLLVAIADVSHYVRPDSPCDSEARTRGTSVYFPDRVIPMLPEALSNELCSLRPQQARLCLAVELWIDAAGKCHRARFCEGVMHSRARLTYTQVADFLAHGGAIDGGAEVATSIGHLSDLYAVLERARTRRGGLDMDIPEVRLRVDEAGEVQGFASGERNRAHRIIEECMLSANVAAADLFVQYSLPVLYRVHPKPKEERIEELRAQLEPLGLELRGGANPTPGDFCVLINAMQQRDNAQGLNMLVLRALSEASYQPENVGHFGLAYQRYLHFTSPIRRYPDLLVHRGIRYLLRRGGKAFRQVSGAAEIPRQQIYPWTKETAKLLQGLGEHCSSVGRRADIATRQVNQWLFCSHLAEHIGMVCDGVVQGVQRFGLFVGIRQLGGDGLLHLNNMPPDRYSLQPGGLIGRSHSFYIGDAMRVQIAAVDLEKMRVDLELA